MRHLLVSTVPISQYAVPISWYGTYQLVRRTYQTVRYLFVVTRYLLVGTVPISRYVVLISWYGPYQSVLYILVSTVPIIRYGTCQSVQYLFFGKVPKMNRSFQRLIHGQTFVSLNAQPATFPVDGYTFHTKYLMRVTKMDNLSRSRS